MTRGCWPHRHKSSSTRNLSLRRHAFDDLRNVGNKELRKRRQVSTYSTATSHGSGHRGSVDVFELLESLDGRALRTDTNTMDCTMHHRVPRASAKPCDGNPFIHAEEYITCSHWFDHAMHKDILLELSLATLFRNVMLIGSWSYYMQTQETDAVKWMTIISASMVAPQHLCDAHGTWSHTSSSIFWQASHLDFLLHGLHRPRGRLPSQRWSFAARRRTTSPSWILLKYLRMFKPRELQLVIGGSRPRSVLLKWTTWGGFGHTLVLARTDCASSPCRKWYSGLIPKRAENSLAIDDFVWQTSSAKTWRLLYSKLSNNKTREENTCTSTCQLRQSAPICRSFPSTSSSTCSTSRCCLTPFSLWCALVGGDVWFERNIPSVHDMFRLYSSTAMTWSGKSMWRMYFVLWRWQYRPENWSSSWSDSDSQSVLRWTLAPWRIMYYRSCFPCWSSSCNGHSVFNLHPYADTTKSSYTSRYVILLKPLPPAAVGCLMR